MVRIAQVMLDTLPMVVLIISYIIYFYLSESYGYLIIFAINLILSSIASSLSFFYYNKISLLFILLNFPTFGTKSFKYVNLF
jgi:hypothetical protein